MNTKPDIHKNRREFLRSGGRSLLLAGLGLLAGGLIAGKRVSPGGVACPPDKLCSDCADGAQCIFSDALPTQNWVWQLDPEKCTQCGRCATHCVLNPSAVKCVHAYGMCGYCKLCFGFFQPGANALSEAAENQLCPTGAIKRKLIESPYYEYRVDESLCVGCAKCVKGCNAFGNGSFHLQVKQDLCLNCNDCAIARNCPADAFRRVPPSQPYLMKKA